MNNHKVDNSFAIIGLVLGILSLLFSFIPCIGMFGGIPAIIALIFSGLAFMKAKDNGDPKTLSIIASVISLLAMAIALFWFITLKSATNDIDVNMDNSNYTDCETLMTDLRASEKQISDIEQELEGAEDLSVLGKVGTVTKLAIKVESMKKKAVDLGCDLGDEGKNDNDNNEEVMDTINGQ